MGIEVQAQTRKQQGTGASRRLRHAGKVPGIVYGGNSDPIAIEIDHNALFHALRNEKFHATVLDLSLDGTKEQVLLRAFNMHPWKPQVQHIDFQRVLADQKIHMKVPLHFVNAEISPALKTGGAIISHVMNEIDIKCLPADLPEYVEVDLKDMVAGATVHVKDLAFPKGVEPAMSSNPAVAVAQVPRGGAEEETASEAPAASAVPAAKQPEKKDDKAAGGGKAAAAPAKAGGDKGGKK